MVLTVTSGRFAYSTMLLMYCGDQGLDGLVGSNNKKTGCCLFLLRSWVAFLTVLTAGFVAITAVVSFCER